MVPQLPISLQISEEAVLPRQGPIEEEEAEFATVYHTQTLQNP